RGGAYADLRAVAVEREADAAEPLQLLEPLPEGAGPGHTGLAGGALPVVEHLGQLQRPAPLGALQGVAGGGRALQAGAVPGGVVGPQFEGAQARGPDEALAGVLAPLADELADGVGGEPHLGAGAGTRGGE